MRRYSTALRHPSMPSLIQSRPVRCSSQWADTSSRYGPDYRGALPRQGRVLCRLPLRLTKLTDIDFTRRNQLAEVMWLKGLTPSPSSSSASRHGSARPGSASPRSIRCQAVQPSTGASSSTFGNTLSVLRGSIVVPPRRGVPPDVTFRGHRQLSTHGASKRFNGRASTRRSASTHRIRRMSV
jgi:hypothetical protein